ncbi:MAG TPA: hypothetical protein VF902_02560 [Coriobacteriia bacterium]
MSNLSRSLRAAICALAFVLPVFAADEPSNATGTLKVSGTTTNLRYAYARKAADGATRVLITSKPLTPAMLAGEPPLGELVRKGQAAGIELAVQPDGLMQTVTVFEQHFDMPTPSTSDGAYWFEPYRMPAGWTGGRSRTREQQEFFDTRWEYDVTYFAAVGQKGFEKIDAAAVAAQRKEIDKREEARIVAPGGGEEGAMYLAFYRNLEAGNKAALDQMTDGMKKAVAQQMQESSLSGPAFSTWAMMHGVPPGKVEIVGGVRDSEGTLLELKRTADGRVKFGTAKIVKAAGAWKIAEENW